MQDGRKNVRSIPYVAVEFFPSLKEEFYSISSGCSALVVPFQQLLEDPMEVLLCERVNDFRQSLFHLLNSLITTASELRE